MPGAAIEQALVSFLTDTSYNNVYLYIFILETVRGISKRHYGTGLIEMMKSKIVKARNQNVLDLRHYPFSALLDKFIRIRELSDFLEVNLRKSG